MITSGNSCPEDADLILAKDRFPNRVPEPSEGPMTQVPPSDIFTVECAYGWTAWTP